MKKHHTFTGIFFVAAILTGCSATQQSPPQEVTGTAWNQAEATRRECHAKLDGGDYKTQAEMVTQCLNPKVMEIYERAGDPDLDLVMLINAKRLELAEQVDAGKITVGQASVTLAEMATKMTDAARQRRQENATPDDAPQGNAGNNPIHDISM